MEMEWYWALCTLIGMVIFLMAMGVPVAFTFILTNIIGVVIFYGDPTGWTPNCGQFHSADYTVYVRACTNFYYDGGFVFPYRAGDKGI